MQTEKRGGIIMLYNYVNTLLLDYVAIKNDTNNNRHDVNMAYFSLEGTWLMTSLPS